MRLTRREDYGLVLGLDNRYKLQRLDGEKPIGVSFPWRGRKYGVEPKRAWGLIAWRPQRKLHVFSDIMAYDGVKRSMAIYKESEFPTDAPILPLDRLRTGMNGDHLPTQVWKAWLLSPLYRRRMAKLRIGGGNMRVALYILIAAVVILVVMMFSGWFGG